MAFLRSFLVASAVAGAAAFSPAGVLPRATARGGPQGMCMNAGGGKIKDVAAFRNGSGGKSAVPTDTDSINLDLVNGVADPFNTVGGVDTTYAKPASSFFGGKNAKGTAAPPPRAAPRVAAVVKSAPAQRGGIWSAPAQKGVAPAQRAPPPQSQRTGSVRGGLRSAGRVASAPAAGSQSAEAPAEPKASPFGGLGARLGSINPFKKGE